MGKYLEEKNNNLFFKSYSLIFFLIYLISDSQINSIYNSRMNKLWLIIIAIILNVIIMMCNKRRLLYYLEILIPFCFLLAPVIFPGTALISTPFFIFSLFLFNSYNITTEHLVKTDLKVRIVFTAFVIIMYFAHLFPNTSAISIRNGIVRYSLGFNSSNTLAMFIYTILVSYILLVNKRIFSWKKFIFFIAIIMITFRLTDSIEFIILGIIILIFILVGKYNFMKSTIHYLVPVAIFFSLFIGLVFILSHDSSFLHYVNNLTSDRIEVQDKATLYYPIRYLGYGSIELLDIYKLNIDNMYMAYLVHYGIIGFSFFAYVFIKAYFISRKIYDEFIDFIMIIVPLSLITFNADFVLFPLIYIYSVKNNRLKGIR